MSVHDEAVFVSAGRERRFLPPVADAGGMQRLGFGLPMVERARDANGVRRRMRKFKANGHKFDFGSGKIVVVMIMFHAGKKLAVV